jgi:hypothetical protein
MNDLPLVPTEKMVLELGKYFQELKKAVVFSFAKKPN